ncbi:peritrophin-44-like [Panulirus ornatus]|uniref:peritrophin-44-like n=1 Tax=Panulirus ornatus TaxID=150431 RepID=UPI003A8C62D7
MKWCMVVVTAMVVVFGASQGGVLAMTTESPKFCAQEISDQCPNIDGSSPVFFANPSNCASYCECSDGRAYYFLCPEDTLYDEKDFVCNWAERVDCGSRPILP